MRIFLRQHSRAFARVFVYALLAYLTLRSLQWVVPALGGATGAQVLLSLPLAWLLGTAFDPLLWKLPLAINLALFELILATGFAVNVVAVTLLVWHRKTTGRWWGGEEPSRVERT